MLSPRFVPSPQSVFYTDRVNRYQPCLFRRYARRRTFITKTAAVILFTNTTLSRLGFGATTKGHFHFRNNETENMLVNQSNPVGVELFPMSTLSLGLCYTFCAQKPKRAK